MEKELISKAITARERAYNPYSKFAVGAALRTAQGQIFTGCNIENSSYGLTICAERVALFNAYSAGQREISALAIAGPGEKLIIPCGACLQVISELAPTAKIIMSNCDGSQTKTVALDELLPMAFRLNTNSTDG